MMRFVVAAILAAWCCQLSAVEVPAWDKPDEWAFSRPTSQERNEMYRLKPYALFEDLQSLREEVKTLREEVVSLREEVSRLRKPKKTLFR